MLVGTAAGSIVSRALQISAPGSQLGRSALVESSVSLRMLHIGQGVWGGLKRTLRYVVRGIRADWKNLNYRVPHRPFGETVAPVAGNMPLSCS